MDSVKMIKKEIKEYARGNSFNYRINIAKQDNLPNEVYILTPTEHDDLINENETIKKELGNKKIEINKLENKIKSIEENSNKLHETLKELDKQHNNQLNENYDKFNEDLKKYIQIITLQNTGLKQILELGFIDIIMNKHKNIANEQIKELSNDKKVYELTQKK